MPRPLLAAAAIFAASFALAASPTLAAPCKDAKGKFTKCPTVAAPAKRCKAPDGKFAKCSTPGAKPI